MKSYLRYLDNLTLFGDSRRQLRGWSKRIVAFARDELDLSVDLERARTRTTAGEILFLGHLVSRHEIRPGPVMRSRMKRKLAALTRGAPSPHRLEKLKRVLVSYRGLVLG